MRSLLIAATTFLSSAFLTAQADAAPFQGPYIGLEAGINRDKSDSVGPFTGRGDQRSASSFAGGVFAGYNATVAPRVVVGGEVTLDATSGTSINNSSGAEPAVLDPKRQINVTARAGYLVTPRTLVYLRGGYTNVRANLAADGQPGTVGHSADLGGWTAGGGIERQLSQTVSARVEYRYSELGRGGGYDRHQVLAALAYHF